MKLIPCPWLLLHIFAGAPGLSFSSFKSHVPPRSSTGRDWTSWHQFETQSMKPLPSDLHISRHSSGSSLFISTNNTSIISQLGSTAIFHCMLNRRVADTLQGPIMWSRDLPFALLAIDGEPHLEDPRIWVERPNDNDTQSDTYDWILAIRKVEREDNGTYKCQTSDHPPKYILTHLLTVEAMAIIDGPKEKFMKGGSRLRLVCLFHNVTKAPETIFWYLNDRMINYDKRFGIDFIANGTILTIPSINSELAGNFTCAPLSITPDSVRVHIIDEEGAAVYGDGGTTLKTPLGLLTTIALGGTLYSKYV